MIWHPLLLALLVVDSLSLILLGAAGLVALQVLTSWEAGSPSEGQLRLERRAEGAALLGRGGGGLQWVAAILWLVSVADVLPALVPGAMCGTGVLAALGAHGSRGLTFRLITLLTLAAWGRLDGLNRARPEAPLTLATARALLLSLPFAGLAWWQTLSGFRGLEGHAPVECCSVVYARAGQGGGLLEGGLSHPWVVGLVLGAGLLLAVWGVVVGLTGRSGVVGSGRRLLLQGLGGLSLLAVPLGAWALVRTLVAYRYQVLEHRCPWCLFLPEHQLVGFPLFGALLLLAIEGLSLLLAAGVGQRVPDFLEASRLARRSAWWAAAAALLFAVLASWPALHWRHAFGVWME